MCNRTCAMIPPWLVLITAGSLAAQEAPASPVAASNEAVRLFLDCQTFLCDLDHFRREITFVNWVRDRRDAKVHVLVTAQRTGGGGWELTLAFIGLAEHAGRDDTLRYVSRTTDTQDETRTGLTRVLKLGLVPYVMRTRVADELTLSHRPATAQTPAGPVDDPWNYWVFTTRVGGDLDGEEQQKRVALNGSLSANRTTEVLKISLSLFARYNRSEFELSPTSTFINTQRNIDFSTLMVWSLDNHWSAGFRSSVRASTFLNQDLATRGGPAIEYNVFPYSESTRRQLTIMYTAGVSTFDYEQETIFDETAEVLPTHDLQVSLRLQQPWGSITTSASAVQFLHDGDGTKHRISLFSGLNIRIFRGLALNLFGNVSRVKDQLYLPKTGLSTEEILVQRRQLGTNFEYFGNIGLSYTFGSKFNNIVNPRMGGSGGFFFFGF